jgi:hypothetical protein
VWHETILQESKMEDAQDHSYALQYLSSRLLHLTTLFQEALSQILMESVSSLMRFGRKQANHQDAQTGIGVIILPFTARKIHFAAIS